jgi:hypothetical protein
MDGSQEQSPPVYVFGGQFLLHASAPTPTPPMKEFPIMFARDRGILNQVQSIPWAMIAPHNPQAQSNHSQTLERLAERGGLSACEAVAVLTNRRWEKMESQAAANKLNELIATYEATLRPRIVCLCGSSRFCDVGAVKAWELEKQGVMAIGMHLLPAWYPNVKPDHMAEHEGVAAVLDALHLKKIEMADSVLVLNVGGYIGERTRIEIEHAKRLGKPVEYLEAEVAK